MTWWEKHEVSIVGSGIAMFMAGVTWLVRTVLTNQAAVREIMQTNDEMSRQMRELRNDLKETADTAKHVRETNDIAVATQAQMAQILDEIHHKVGKMEK